MFSVLKSGWRKNECSSWWEICSIIMVSQSEYCNIINYPTENQGVEILEKASWQGRAEIREKYKKIEALTNVTEQSRHNPLMISTLSVVYLLINTKCTIIHQTVLNFEWSHLNKTRYLSRHHSESKKPGIPRWWTNQSAVSLEMPTNKSAGLWSVSVATYQTGQGPQRSW